MRTIRVLDPYLVEHGFQSLNETVALRPKPHILDLSKISHLQPGPEARRRMSQILALNPTLDPSRTGSGQEPEPWHRTLAPNPGPGPGPNPVPNSGPAPSQNLSRTLALALALRLTLAQGSSLGSYPY